MYVQGMIDKTQLDDDMWAHRLANNAKQRRRSHRLSSFFAGQRRSRAGILEQESGEDEGEEEDDMLPMNDLWAPVPAYLKGRRGLSNSSRDVWCWQATAPTM